MANIDQTGKAEEDVNDRRGRRAGRKPVVTTKEPTLRLPARKKRTRICACAWSASAAIRRTRSVTSSTTDASPKFSHFGGDLVDDDRLAVAARWLRVEHEVGDELGRFVVQRRRNVAVDAEGDGDRRVAETFLHNAGVNSALESERRPGVAQALQGQRR